MGSLGAAEVGGGAGGTPAEQGAGLTASPPALGCGGLGATASRAHSVSCFLSQQQRVMDSPGQRDG